MPDQTPIDLGSAYGRIDLDTADALRTLARFQAATETALRSLSQEALRFGGHLDGLQTKTNTLAASWDALRARQAALQTPPQPATPPASTPRPAHNTAYHINVSANSRAEGESAGRGLYDELVRRGML